MKPVDWPVWIFHNDRVKYIADTRYADYQKDVYYITLDGKFHSWICWEWENGWVLRTVKNPNFPIKMESMSVWMDIISQ